MRNTKAVIVAIVVDLKRRFRRPFTFSIFSLRNLFRNLIQVICGVFFRIICFVFNHPMKKRQRQRVDNKFHGFSTFAS